ncbi:MAG: DALR anticodon-binding domain-containing protein [Acidobacteriota bacterium]
MELMERLDIKYDSLIRERDIIELNLFEEASDILKNNNIMYLSEDPEKEGCQVIKYNTENIEKIIIRSNGTATYIAKDIAYALWKVGLLNRDFYFRKFFEYGESSTACISDFNKNSEKKNFGKGDKVYTVIDVRQSYLQKIISEEVIHPLSNRGNKKEYIHFSYEMVALTPQCVEELGFEVNEEEKQKSYIEVSGRKGRAVKGSHLIDILTEKSKNEVKKRDPRLSEDDITSIAKDIAVGALRYFMIKFNSNTVISFDFQDALSFEGDTGPYLQYTMVRINSIIKKLDKKDTGFFMEGGKIEELMEDEKALYFDILLNLSLLEIQVEHAIEKNEISAIASFTYSLCQKFNHYYHLYPIVSEKNIIYKKIRINLLILFKKRLAGLFSIMGIPVPFKM